MAAKENIARNTPRRQLRDDAAKGLLRFMTCGSVDDGKSTLLGRLLYDTGALFGDQLAKLQSDSERFGAAENDLDFSLLLDGLEAEREQKITIDVAYRYFATRRRKFIVADAPGHEQYTRNMATAASNVDLAIILVDAEKGLLPQTRRHAYIASLLGVRKMVLAVNKMDRVRYKQSVFEAIRDGFKAFARRLAVDDVKAVPVSALKGDNIMHSSPHMGWYTGPSLLDLLETIPVEQDLDGPMRMPVQRVVRPDQTFRGYAGTIVQGSVRPGDSIVALPSGQTTAISRIVTFDGDLDHAAAGQAVTLVLERETDISRGDVIAAAADAPEEADQFAVHVVWLNEEPLYPGRPYHVKIGNCTLTGQITELKHRIDMNSLDQLAAPHLDINEIGYGTLGLDRAIPFEPYGRCRTLGGFIMIDRFTNATVGCGMIDFALWRATTVPWQYLEINKAARADLNRQKPVVLWFTGLSGAGKSTVANAIAKRLHARGQRTYLLDGDNLRHGLNRDLGFRPEDRVENVRRVGEVAKLFVDAGLIVLASLISPFRSERLMVRDMLEPDEFIEIFVEAPIEECERRDPKGLYARARAGEIRNFTGIDSPYEPPDNPELVLNTVDATPEGLADRVFVLLEHRGVI
ncbi:MAG: sulfate adenylyltransferase subunit CysN [Proteobacteria bacterium]|nr:sulfate adenylyltransferase subunit CysN [Pseudomonadota bacterium]